MRFHNGCTNRTTLLFSDGSRWHGIMVILIFLRIVCSSAFSVADCSVTNGDKPSHDYLRRAHASRSLFLAIQVLLHMCPCDRIAHHFPAFLSGVALLFGTCQDKPSPVYCATASYQGQRVTLVTQSRPPGEKENIAEVPAVMCRATLREHVT